MNDLSEELRENLYAFRNDRTKIRKILCRGHWRGSAWAIQKFQVLKELSDSQTVGKEEEKLKRAKKRVDRLIRYQVFKYIERNYMIDENDEVVLRPDAEIRQQQQQLVLNNPSPMVRAPGGTFPFPIGQNIPPNPVCNNLVDAVSVNNSVTHHHRGADHEGIKNINKKLDDLPNEQNKQGKEIVDLTVSDTDLRTTVHDTMKKKPLSKNEDLLNCTTPSKRFDGDDEDIGVGPAEAHCDSLNDDLMNDSCFSPRFMDSLLSPSFIARESIESSSPMRKQESIPPAPTSAPWSPNPLGDKTNISNTYVPHSVYQEDVQKMNKKLDDLPNEQNKQGKEIEDLTVSDTDLRTTVHNPTKKDKDLLNCTTPSKLFDGDDQDTGPVGPAEAHCDFLNDLMNDKLLSPRPSFIARESTESSSPMRKQEPIPPLAPTSAPWSPNPLGNTTNSTVGDRDDNDAGEQHKVVPHPAPASAPWSPNPLGNTTDMANTYVPYSVYQEDMKEMKKRYQEDMQEMQKQIEDLKVSRKDFHATVDKTLKKYWKI